MFLDILLGIPVVFLVAVVVTHLNGYRIGLSALTEEIPTVPKAYQCWLFDKIWLASYQIAARKRLRKRR